MEEKYIWELFTKNIARNYLKLFSKKERWLNFADYL